MTVPLLNLFDHSCRGSSPRQTLSWVRFPMYVLTTGSLQLNDSHWVINLNKIYVSERKIHNFRLRLKSFCNTSDFLCTRCRYGRSNNGEHLPHFLPLINVTFLLLFDKIISLNSISFGDFDLIYTWPRNQITELRVNPEIHPHPTIILRKH